MVREANLGRSNRVYGLLPDIGVGRYVAAGRFMRNCGPSFVLLFLWGVDSRRTIPVHTLLFDGGCSKRGAALFFVSLPCNILFRSGDFGRPTEQKRRPSRRSWVFFLSYPQKYFRSNLEEKKNFLYL